MSFNFRLFELLLFIGLTSAPAFAVENGGATVIKVTGQATVAGKALKTGDTLKPDDEVEVAKTKDAYVDLKLAEGHAVRLREGTRLKIGTFVNGLRILSLSKGKTFVRFEKSSEANRLEVRTKAVVAGVRGTKFAVSIDDVLGTYICVCEGAVQAQKPDGGDIKTVAAGQDIWATTYKPLGRPLNSPGMSKITEQEFETMKY